MNDFVIGKVVIPQGMVIPKYHYKDLYGWDPEADTKSEAPSELTEEQSEKHL